ncbi:hypothetical protein [Micromonospora peucetia]|uniref:DUF3137 domain-containing protein n=2 Tax=Micromonospora peucetia TaxID=47871 RepID=A0ABZ1EIU4_9ACTN|nr:hypothetical protein [Micromonospora peucetia]WSA34143.1 hypothetical protein OIE14_08920 [Micromonospora peucetia]
MDRVTTVFWMGGCVGLVLLLGAGLAAIVVVAHRQERERRDSWRRWAAHQGWTFTENPQVAWTGRVPGRNRRGVRFALTGTMHGRPVGVAEYAYTETHTSTGADGNQTTSSQTHAYVVAFVWLRRPFPDLAVAPRHVFSKLGRALFGSDGYATGNAEFDRQWRVGAAAPGQQALVGPTLLAAHLAGAVPAWSVRGPELITYRSGRLHDHTSVGSLVTPLITVADLLEQGR